MAEPQQLTPAPGSRIVKDEAEIILFGQPPEVLKGLLREGIMRFDTLVLTDIREKDGSLRAGIDTVQFYITLSGMCYFYITNIHTLSVVFDRDLSTDEALEKRRRHIIDTIMTSVRS